MGMATLPMPMVPLGFLIFTYLIIPKSSLVGHLSGILVGYLLASGALDPLNLYWMLSISAWMGIGESCLLGAVHRCHQMHVASAGTLIRHHPDALCLSLAFEGSKTIAACRVGQVYCTTPPPPPPSPVLHPGPLICFKSCSNGAVFQYNFNEPHSMLHCPCPCLYQHRSTAKIHFYCMVQ